MLLNAQLDNDKAGLTYQVENLKDIIVDLRESLLSMQVRSDFHFGRL
jgi:hypothetical protein